MVQAIADQIRKENEKLVRDALSNERFIAFLLDETTDVSNVGQLVVHLRIALRGELYHRFGEMIPLSTRKTAQAILDHTNTYCEGK